MLCVLRSVAHYVVTFGRNHSPLGCNLLFCMNQYKCSLCDIFSICRIDGFIVKRVFNCSTDRSMQQADLLRDCVIVQDGLFTLPK